MTPQPKALQMADHLDELHGAQEEAKYMRHLHEANLELLNALEELVQVTAHVNPCPATLEQAIVAIKKARGEQS